jgi:GMP synthase PP-ATPase subunit
MCVVVLQGTIYPDTIESGGKKNGKQVAAVIKTHHNRVPEIDALIEAGLIVEPCADLYKDEVRAVGEKLGLPKFLVWRHPFPGPGLGVRLLCHPGTVDESIDAAALCAEEEAIKVMVGGDISVSIPHLKSVGVQGDSEFCAVFDTLRSDWTLRLMLPPIVSHRQNVQALCDIGWRLRERLGSPGRVCDQDH